MSAIDLRDVVGAKATHRFARLSASKARAVLDLVRDTDVGAARDILRDTDRGAADVIGKVLESAVSNAEVNHHLDAEALYVAECWADEGPTLKRFRPRARGRATRINKRTCHITIVLAELDEEEIAARAEARTRTPAGGDRAARVAASRRAQDDTTTDEDEPEVPEVEGASDVAESEDAPDVEAVSEVEGAADVAESEDAPDVEDVPEVEDAADVAESEDAPDVEDVPEVEDAADVAESEDAGGPHGEGSHAALDDGSMPDGFPIKGNADSMRYHAPGSRYYEATVAEVWFASTEAAEAAGFTPVAGSDESAVESESDESTEESS